MQAPLLAGGPEHQAVALHQWFQGVVAPADHGCHWNLTPQTGIEDQAVALEQTRTAEAEPPQAVLPVGVHAGVVEHQIGIQ